jgi:hypothetical protein
MKTYGGVEIQTLVFLTSALDGDELSASYLGCFTSGEEVPLIHCLGGLVGLRANLDAVVKRKNPSPQTSHYTAYVQVKSRLEFHYGGVYFSLLLSTGCQLFDAVQS